MVLTFFLGNGFDINLGRATRYSNFYDYYKQQPSAYPVVQKLKDDIEEYRDKAWKDLELGLGQFTAKVKTVEEFLIAFADITIELTKYLRSEEQTFSLTDPELYRKLILDFQEHEG